MAILLRRKPCRRTRPRQVSFRARVRFVVLTRQSGSLPLGACAAQRYHVVGRSVGSDQYGRLVHTHVQRLKRNLKCGWQQAQILLGVPAQLLTSRTSCAAITVTASVC